MYTTNLEIKKMTVHDSYTTNTQLLILNKLFKKQVYYWA